MKEVKTYGKIVGGRPLFYRLTEFWENVSHLGEGRIELIVKKSYRKRTNDQNQYYWGVVIDCFVSGYADTSGERISPDEAHGFLKGLFNSKEIVHPGTGEVEKIPMSTASLNTSEMTDYIEKCRYFIYEWFRVEVPDPNLK